jgi:hypothetical protein
MRSSSQNRQVGIAIHELIELTAVTGVDLDHPATAIGIITCAFRALFHRRTDRHYFIGFYCGPILEIMQLPNQTLMAIICLPAVNIYDTP